GLPQHQRPAAGHGPIRERVHLCTLNVSKGDGSPTAHARSHPQRAGLGALRGQCGQELAPPLDLPITRGILLSLLLLPVLNVLQLACTVLSEGGGPTGCSNQNKRHKLHYELSSWKS